MSKFFRGQTTFIINDESKTDFEANQERGRKVMSYVAHSKLPGNANDIVPSYFGCQTCQKNTQDLQKNLQYMSMKKMSNEKETLKGSPEKDSSVEQEEWNNFAPHQIESYPTHPTNFKKKSQVDKTVSSSKNLSIYASIGKFLCLKK